jgi:hypothetical protein
MRYFFRQRVPPLDHVLLVESGSRHISEYLLPLLRRAWNPDLVVDLVTCYSGLPAGFPPETRLFFTYRYLGRAGRRRLYRELRSLGYSVMGIVCAGEPIMTKWKWVLALRLPVKVFVVNENVDFFWLDYSQWRTIRHFLLYRAGLAGAGAARTLARLLLFPFTVLYLLLFAAAVHLRRKVRT